MSTEVDYRMALDRATEGGYYSLRTALREDGFDPTVDYNSLARGKSRTEETNLNREGF